MVIYGASGTQFSPVAGSTYFSVAPQSMFRKPVSGTHISIDSIEGICFSNDLGKSS